MVIKIKCDYCCDSKIPRVKLEIFKPEYIIKHFCSVECCKLWLRFNG